VRPDDQRSDSRERALHLLYEAHAKSLDVREVVEAQLVPPDPMAADLVEGVASRRDEIDALIAARATGWSLHRMPVLDLDVMRLATYELLGHPETPVAVIIDEAVSLAKRFSTDNSGRFVNGVLAAIAAEIRADG
jgi:transcription antitermination protein NusB